MDWHITILAGAAGGLIVEAVAFLTSLNEYREARRQARAAVRKRTRPRWDRYFDPIPDTLAAFTRLLLGGVREDCSTVRSQQCSRRSPSVQQHRHCFDSSVPLGQ